jgi:23S rRNA-/tRNA-specific pseudouridylate synthase
MLEPPRLLTRFGDTFYAFDKPAGMAVHPANEDIPDLVSWMKRQRSLPRDLKPGHRLDRATSGVVLCGAGRKARAQIAEWLEGADKVYLALVAGRPIEEEGIFDSPLFDARRKRELVCKTLYRVREKLGGFTLLELQLVTGRKHQLRRHLADAGLPIVGDQRYGPRRPKPVPAFPGRLWLHAWKLSFSDRTIEAKLPADLQVQLDALP